MSSWLDIDVGIDRTGQLSELLRKLREGQILREQYEDLKVKIKKKGREETSRRKDLIVPKGAKQQNRRLPAFAGLGSEFYAPTFGVYLSRQNGTEFKYVLISGDGSARVEWDKDSDLTPRGEFAQGPGLISFEEDVTGALQNINTKWRYVPRPYGYGSTYGGSFWNSSFSFVYDTSADGSCRCAGGSAADCAASVAGYGTAVWPLSDELLIPVWYTNASAYEEGMAVSHSQNIARVHRFVLPVDDKTMVFVWHRRQARRDGIVRWRIDTECYGSGYHPCPNRVPEVTTSLISRNANVYSGVVSGYTSASHEYDAQTADQYKVFLVGTSTITELEMPAALKSYLDGLMDDYSSTARYETEDPNENPRDQYPGSSGVSFFDYQSGFFGEGKSGGSPANPFDFPFPWRTWGLFKGLFFDNRAPEFERFVFQGPGGYKVFDTPASTWVNVLGVGTNDEIVEKVFPYMTEQYTRDVLSDMLTTLERNAIGLCTSEDGCKYVGDSHPATQYSQVLGGAASQATSAIDETWAAFTDLFVYGYAIAPETEIAYKEEPSETNTVESPLPTSEFTFDPLVAWAGSSRLSSWCKQQLYSLGFSPLDIP